MAKITLIPSTPANEGSGAPRVSDIQVGATRGRRFLYVKGPEGQTREFKINDLVKGLERAIKDENFQPEELERIQKSIVKFTETKKSGFLHAVRSFFSKMSHPGFKREAKMESISHQIGELKRQGELQRHQNFQNVMQEGKDLHVYAVRDVDGLISPLFYKDSDAEDKKFISYGIPSGKTAENVAEGIIQDLKDYSKSAEHDQFRGHPVNSADQKFMSELGSKAANEPEKTKAALVHLILMKKAGDENTVYISASEQKAIKMMKGNKEVAEVAERLVAQCTDPTTDVAKLKKLLEHDAVKDNKELKSVIVDKAINVQVTTIRSCQLSFISPLLGNAGMALKKILWELRDNPSNTDHLNGIEGLRELATSESIPFPTKTEVEQKQNDDSVRNFLNTYEKNYDEAIVVLNEIKEVKGQL